ncbi:MAG: BrxA/BrxB family bacilliredoxin, partial [Gemmatimonadota bacterium]|nr:BrxA/BrxB family bacilliredoxin [Gemmatimonadota bacterium]
YLTTVFAGMELEATDKTREYFQGYPPSSPQIGLLRDGELLFLLERHDIEGRDANEIAERLVEAFDEHCTKVA